MENKYLSRRVTFGFSWLLWVLALVALLTEKNNLTIDDKRELLSSIISWAAIVICTFIPLIGWIAEIVILVFVIIAAVKAFLGQTFQVPGAYHLAAAIIKEQA